MMEQIQEDTTLPSQEERVTAILDRGTKFEGKLSFEGVVQISGEFSGEIFSQDTLIINDGANVTAEVEADTIIVSGKVEGNLFARSRILMHPPAIFRGTVTTPSLRIDEGVVFEGASYMPKK
jgi:cytoskeletal protein CcmA (bactofilin family)